MAFTQAELDSIANASLDFYFKKGDIFQQTIQAKPLLDKMERSAKSFPGGKGDISLAVKGQYGDGSGNDIVQGYTHNDTVSFYTPANIMRANYAWREHHIGLTLTHTELKIDGISVDDTNGHSTSSHSNREMHVLVNLLEDKLQDMGEQYARSMNELMWGDGTVDALALHGIRHFIVEDPTVGVVGGIDAAVDTWWRNRARTAAAGNAITSSPANGGALIEALQQEYRQLIRFGGKPNLMLAGSDFINAMEVEMRANGYYSDSGFSRGGDVSMGQLRFRGAELMYDPTLDDLGLEKFMYWIDTSAIFLEKMQGEWRKTHNPARPADAFVIYKSITSTGQMVATRRNSSGVYEIA